MQRDDTFLYVDVSCLMHQHKDIAITKKKKKKYLMKILKISMAGLLMTNEVFISRMIKLNQFFSQVNKELRIFVN